MITASLFWIYNFALFLYSARKRPVPYFRKSTSSGSGNDSFMPGGGPNSPSGWRRSRSPSSEFFLRHRLNSLSRPRRHMISAVPPICSAPLPLMQQVAQNGFVPSQGIVDSKLFNWIMTLFSFRIVRLLLAARLFFVPFSIYCFCLLIISSNGWLLSFMQSKYFCVTRHQLFVLFLRTSMRI